MDFKRSPRRQPHAALDGFVTPRSAPRPAPAVHPVSPPKPARVSTKKPFFRRIHLDKAERIAAGIALLVIIAAGIAFVIEIHHAPETLPTATAPHINPTFTTVLPTGTSINKLGGWQCTQPQKGEQVCAFADTIAATPVIVSEQPLPASFANDPTAQIAQLAKNYNATTTIDADGLTAYIGTSAKGPQSAIITKNNLLILIKSQQKIADNDWKHYIESLR